MIIIYIGMISAFAFILTVFAEYLYGAFMKNLTGGAYISNEYAVSLAASIFGYTRYTKLYYGPHTWRKGAASATSLQIASVAVMYILGGTAAIILWPITLIALTILLIRKAL